MEHKVMMVATRPLTYATRRLLAGDEFPVKSERDAKLLRAIKKARDADVRKTANVPPPPKKLVEKVAQVTVSKSDNLFSSAPVPVPAPAPSPTAVGATAVPLATDQSAQSKQEESNQAYDRLKELRAKYQEIIGKAPFNGWTEEQLNAKIAEFQNPKPE